MSRFRPRSRPSAVQPGDPACFTSRRCRDAPARSRPNSTPQLTYRTHFQVHFGTRKGSKSGANSPDHPCLIRRSEWSFWNPVREFGGTENHPAPNDPKLGRLRCARQGLVRVPESNTKYGGKGGNPRGQTAPRLGPSISESSGIPKRKKSFPEARSGLHPAVHRATIYCGPGAVWGLLLGDSRRATEMLRLACR